MAETTQRDVNNHVLFEIATEVANRGISLPHSPIEAAEAQSDIFQLAVSILCSSRKLR